MPSIQRSIASALAAAVTSSFLLAVPGFAQAPATTLTSVKPGGLRAWRLASNGPMLTGPLLQATTCDRVKFEPSAATIVTPIYRAVMYRVSNGPCGQIDFYARASIAIPPGARVVEVQASNGNFKVPVR